MPIAHIPAQIYSISCLGAGVYETPPLGAPGFVFIPLGWWFMAKKYVWPCLQTSLGYCIERDLCE